MTDSNGSLKRDAFEGRTAWIRGEGGAPVYLIDGTRVSRNLFLRDSELGHLVDIAEGSGDVIARETRGSTVRCAPLLTHREYGPRITHVRKRSIRYWPKWLPSSLWCWLAGLSLRWAAKRADFVALLGRTRTGKSSVLTRILNASHIHLTHEWTLKTGTPELLSAAHLPCDGAVAIDEACGVEPESLRLTMYELFARRQPVFVTLQRADSAVMRAIFECVSENRPVNVLVYELLDRNANLDTLEQFGIESTG